MPPRRTREPDIPETDRIAGFAHPRETLRLLGQESALRRASVAIRSGKPPPGWLIAGPPGVGKATLAYRIARYLLAFGATDAGPADLAVPDREGHTMRVRAGSHPGLLVLKRNINPDTGRLMTVISVNEIRRLGGFFGMTSGAGGWRVAIVDTADDMNDNAANAILKLLEEPPSRAILLLLAHMPGRLLPTIRSRCQRLDLASVPSELVARELETLLPDLDREGRESIAKLSGGSIGMALRLAAGDGVLLAREADRLIDAADRPDIQAILGFADKLARMTDGMETFATFVQQGLTERIRARALSGAPGLVKWLDCLAALKDSFGRTSALYLDPRQTVLSAANELARTARRAGPL